MGWDAFGSGFEGPERGRGEQTGVLTGSGGTAPQHSAARLSSTSDIAGPPPATARGPDRHRAALLSRRPGPHLRAPPPPAPPG